MMEFEAEHDEEEEEEEEDEDEQDQMDEDLSITPISTSFKTYHLNNNNNNNNNHNNNTNKANPPGPIAACRYRECLKNHAVTLGGHALDGCGEFMPAGPDTSIESLKCAACNCHRNFHRKEILLEPSNQLALYTPTRPHHFNHPPPHHVNYQFYPRNVVNNNPTTPSPTSFLHVSPGPRPLGLPPGEGDHVEEMGMMTSSSCRKKRYRTKFTPEQKEKMAELAEKLEWKIQKQDETVVANFCNETGLKRHVLKVWMHNNKHTLGKKDKICPSS